MPTGSVTDLTVILTKDVTKDEVNAAMKTAAEGPLKGILAYQPRPDRLERHRSRLPLVDLRPDWTQVMQGNLVKVLSWYDNEWGYSCAPPSWSPRSPTSPEPEPSKGRTEPIGLDPRSIRRCPTVGNRAAGPPRCLALETSGRTLRPHTPRRSHLYRRRPVPKQTVRDLDLHGKKVLVRVDFNVPQTDDGAVARTTAASARPCRPSITFSNQGGSLILVSHLGRPTGDPAKDAPFRMDEVADRLQELIGRPVTKADDTVGPSAQKACADLKPGGIVVLENVRFNKGEKKGDPEFAKALAGLADCYVNDAFGTSHRDEASMVAVPEQFPTRAAGHRLSGREGDQHPRDLARRLRSGRWSPSWAGPRSPTRSC